MMKKIAIVVLAIALTACSKIQEQNILGVWTVENVDQTFTTDGTSGPINTKEDGVIFYEGDQMEFTKTSIIPCPSIISEYGLTRFPEFPGSFDYVFDSASSCITIPERHFEWSFDDPETGYHGDASMTIRTLTYNVIKQDNSTLCLTRENDVHDEKGNYVGVDHYRVTLSR